MKPQKKILDTIRLIYIALSFCTLCADTDNVCVILLIAVNFCLASWQTTKIDYSRLKLDNNV